MISQTIKQEITDYMMSYPINSGFTINELYAYIESFYDNCPPISKSQIRSWLDYLSLNKIFVTKKSGLGRVLFYTL